MSEPPLHARSTCRALVITCSDFRFKTVERAFAETAGIVDDYDLIARPGSVRSLVAARDDAARASMEDEVRLLWKLHAFPRVLMINHLDCRAYDDIAIRADNREIHIAHLRAAAEAVRGICEGVRPETYLVTTTNGAQAVERVTLE